MLKNAKKANRNQQTDRQTDRQTDIVTYRVALHVTKNQHVYERIHILGEKCGPLCPPWRALDTPLGAHVATRVTSGEGVGRGRLVTVIAERVKNQN